MTEIFFRPGGSRESWLQVNDDGTLTYVSENDGWRMARRGQERYEDTMTAEEAKRRWPAYAAKIDEALAKLRSPGEQSA